MQAHWRLVSGALSVAEFNANIFGALIFMSPDGHQS